MRWEPHDRGTSSAAPAPGPLGSGRVGGGRGAGVAACTPRCRRSAGRCAACAACVAAARRADAAGAASGPVDAEDRLRQRPRRAARAGRDDRGGGAAAGAGRLRRPRGRRRDAAARGAASRLPRGCSASTSPPSTLEARVVDRPAGTWRRRPLLHARRRYAICGIVVHSGADHGRGVLKKLARFVAGSACFCHWLGRPGAGVPSGAGGRQHGRAPSTRASAG